MRASTVLGLVTIIPAFIASYSFRHGDIAWGVVCIVVTVLVGLVSLAALVEESR